MGKRKGFSTKSGITILLLGICSYFTIPVSGDRYGNVKSLLGKKIEHFSIEETDSEEQQCQRLPPKYSNASGSLQFAHFDLLSLLKHGTDLIDRTKYVEKATLILGNTGSGKTTISQILSGKLDSLHAVLTQSERLVIIDDNFKISGPSTTSKTLIPELVLMGEEEGEENDSANYGANVTEPTIFYDCPGFDDTRGPEEDLAASFFMNHIVRRKVNQVKMLFLVIHSSVKMGNDRLDFDLLASHATKFVKNLEKYQNSIGLVVTKVNSFNARGRYIQDKTIQKEIIEFLQVYVENMKLKLTNPKLTFEERAATENKIKFAEILLQRNKNGEYSRIAFSRDPEKCGPLSDSRAVSQNRQRILTLSKEQLQFTPANYSDFGYTLKDSTTLTMHRVSQNVNREIASSIEAVLSSFENWMNTVKFSGSGTTSNVTETLEIVESTLLELSKLVDNLQSHSSSNVSSSVDTTTTAAAINVVEIAKLFTRALRKVGYHVSSKVEHLMERQQAYIEFFHADDTAKILETWIDSVKKLRDEYEGLQSWCEFCQNVEEKMTSYSFQKDVKNGLMADNFEHRNASGWLRALEIEAKIPVSLKLKEIAGQFDNGSKREHFKNIFMKTVEFATKQNQIQCNGTTVHVFGNFVRVSEFADDVTENRICSSGRLIKRLEVYASHTIFIDADISAMGRELNVVFIAPNWRVMGKRKFSLQGSNAPEIYPAKARSGRHHYGEDGENGAPGKPGGPGGSMFGVAEKVTRDTEGDVLHVNLNGGDGGPGQVGGDGGNGLDGRATAHGSNFRESRDVNILWLYVKDRVEYDGYSGTPGGNAGYGGFGGNPGLAGTFTVNILGTEDANIIQSSRNAGRMGQTGDPGKAGEGGNPGNGMRCYKSRFLIFSTGPNCETTSARASRASSGFSFWNIFNTNGVESAKWPEYFVVKWQSLLNFKKNFYQEEKGSITTKQFMRTIESSTSIMGDVTNQIKFFVGEFYFLDQQQSSLALSGPSTLSLYTDFIKKVEAFTARANLLLQETSSERKTSNLLLAAAYSKLVSLKQGEKSLAFVQDIQGYLNNVKLQLEGYSFRNLSAVLNNVEKRFEAHVHKKADMLNEFVGQWVTPSIVNADRDQQQRFVVLERKIMEILNSTTTATSEGNNGIGWEKIKWQLEKDKDVQETLQLKQVYQVIPLIANLSSFLSCENTLAFLTDQDSRKNGLLTQLQLSVPFSSRNGSETAEMYLNQALADKLVDLPEKKDQVEKLLNFIQLLAEDAHEMRKNVEQSVGSFTSLIMSYLVHHRWRLEGALWGVATQHWQVKNHVENIKKKLASLAEGIAVDSQQVYKNAIERTQLVLTMISDLYDSIDQYQNIKILAGYLENSEDKRGRSSSSSSVDSQLEKMIGHNVLEREYQKALRAFRQWVFPFAKLYKSKRAPSFFTFEQAKRFYVKQVETLGLEVEEMGRNETTTRIHQSVGGVIRDYYAEPFFLWENSLWGREIKDLLAGKRVTMNADITNIKAAGQKNAVKFHSVGLKFKVKGGNGDVVEEEELNTLLGKVRATLTHSGVFFNKYNDEFYVMTGKNQTIQYNFTERNNSQQDGESSNSYEVNFQISPYTLWTMQLEVVVDTNGTLGSTEVFEDLKKWGKIVDLELVGRGEYMEDNGYRLEVDTFYVRDDGLILDKEIERDAGGDRNTEKDIESEEEMEDYYYDSTPMPQ